jgi:hypothetical protein
MTALCDPVAVSQRWVNDVKKMPVQLYPTQGMTASGAKTIRLRCRCNYTSARFRAQVSSAFRAGFPATCGGAFGGRFCGDRFESPGRFRFPRVMPRYIDPRSSVPDSLKSTSGIPGGIGMVIPLPNQARTSSLSIKTPRIWAMPVEV